MQFPCSDHSIEQQIPGADVIHPPPHSQGRPSFTAVVGSVDSNAAKYVSTSNVQDGKREMIKDLKDMVKVCFPFHVQCYGATHFAHFPCQDVLEKYKHYRQHVEKKTAEYLNPKRLLFYRGLSLRCREVYNHSLIFNRIDGVSEGEFDQVLKQG